MVWPNFGSISCCLHEQIDYKQTIVLTGRLVVKQALNYPSEVQARGLIIPVINEKALKSPVMGNV